MEIAEHRCAIVFFNKSFFFFFGFVGLEPSDPEDGPVVYPANAFDSRLRGD